MTDSCEEAVRVSAMGQQQLHELVMAGPHGYEEAEQRVQVRLCPGLQQHFGTRDVTVTHCKIQRRLPHVTIVAGNVVTQKSVDIEALLDE